MSLKKYSLNVIIPDSGFEILRQELALAFTELGFNARLINPKSFANNDLDVSIDKLISKGLDLFFSVNFQGLNSADKTGNKLLEAKVPVLVWCVDNPWNILSSLREPSWREFTIAVTDSSFIQPLKESGCKQVIHMPLAASPKILQRSLDFCRIKQPPASLFGSIAPLVFAGRTAFPELDRFFYGITLNEDEKSSIDCFKNDWLSSNSSDNKPIRPDFSWWISKMQLNGDEGVFWPGKKARRPAFAAAISNAWWRFSCLNSADSTTIYGDDGWSRMKKEVGGKAFDLRSMFDYYAYMPALYKKSEFSLNLNSLVLSEGLSQRIFDVWAVGGFCLSDYSAGLNIFPDELVKSVTFSHPSEINSLIDNFKSSNKENTRIRKNWQEVVLKEHTYTTRLKVILNTLDII